MEKFGALLSPALRSKQAHVEGYGQLLDHSRAQGYLQQTILEGARTQGVARGISQEGEDEVRNEKARRRKGWTRSTNALDAFACQQRNVRARW